MSVTASASHGDMPFQDEPDVSNTCLKRALISYFCPRSHRNFKKEGMRVSRPSKQKEKDSSDEAEDDDEE